MYNSIQCMPQFLEWFLETSSHFPLPHTLLPLHPPTHSTLHPNPWNCDNNISVLFQLVHSGIVTNGNQLRCTNGTLIRDLGIEIEGMTTLTSLA